MKRFIFFISLFFLSQKIDAQIVFCPAGAEWHYLFTSFTWEYSNEQVKYLRDSVLGIDTAKVLAHTRYFNSFNMLQGIKYTLLKQQGNKVLMRGLSTQHTWQTLYDFGATAGQSWVTTITNLCYPQSNTVTVLYTTIVDSTNTVNINGFNLKRLFVKCWSQMALPLGYDRAVITERIGSDDFLFCFRNSNCGYSDGDWLSAVLCYQDSAFGLKQFTEKSCSYRGYLGLEENTSQNKNFKISPNPGNEFFTINTENETSTWGSIVTIKDLSGRTLKQIKLGSLNAEKINIASLTNGVYILNITNNNIPVYTGKLVKQD